MNVFKSILAATLLVSSVSSYAISFTSNGDDACVGGCTISTDTDRFWVNPASTTELSGASWIQDQSSWHVNDTGYAVYEIDFDGYSDYTLSSLFVSYDDELIVSIGDTVIFDSEDKNLDSPWTFVTDVFDNTFNSIYFDNYIAAGNKLSFAVVNSDDYATGVVWKGEAASVPEPSMIIALGLGLVAFGVRRRKNTNL